MKTNADLALLKSILYLVKEEYERHGLGISREELIAHCKVNGFDEDSTAAMADSHYASVFMSIAQFASGRKIYKWSDRRTRHPTIKHTQSVESYPIVEYLPFKIEARKKLLLNNEIQGKERDEIIAEIDLLERIEKETPAEINECSSVAEVKEKSFCQCEIPTLGQKGITFCGTCELPFKHLAK